MNDSEPKIVRIPTSITSTHSTSVEESAIIKSLPESIPPAQVGQKQPRTLSGDADVMKDILVSGNAPVPPVPNKVEVYGSSVLTVIDTDDRIEVIDELREFLAMICDLEITDKDGNISQGTGWLADQYTVVTAAHCVYHPTNLKGWASSVKVRPYENPDNPSFRPLDSNIFSITGEWSERQAPEFDFAAIHLKEPFPESIGAMAFGHLENSALIDQLVNVTGFPGDQEDETLWTHRNRLMKIHPQMLEYENDTAPGQSGSPVYLFPDGLSSPPLVVGIHAYGATQGNMKNSAPRINSLVERYLKFWIQSAHGLDPNLV